MNPSLTLKAMLIPAMVLLVAAVVHADSPAPAPGAPVAPPAGSAPILPGVKVDLQEKLIDLDAEVCLEAGMLELVGTPPQGKQHESILTLKPRPQHIHLALLMLGLKNGTPGKWVYENNKARAVNATGDKVTLSLVYTKDGKTVEEPIQTFIRDTKTKKPLDSSMFIFAGSTMLKNPSGGDPVYAADIDQDVISVVSKNDEVLALPVAASDSNESLEWEITPNSLPKLGTKALLRIRPVVEEKKK